MPQGRVEHPAFAVVDRPDDGLILAGTAIRRVVEGRGQNVRVRRHARAVIELIGDAERIFQAARDGMLTVDELHREAVAGSVGGLGRALRPPAADHLQVFGPGRLPDAGGHGYYHT